MGSLAQDALAYLSEDAFHTDTCTEDHAGVLRAIAEVKEECTLSHVHQDLLQRAADKQRARTQLRNARYAETVGIRPYELVSHSFQS